MSDDEPDPDVSDDESFAAAYSAVSRVAAPPPAKPKASGAAEGKLKPAAASAVPNTAIAVAPDPPSEKLAFPARKPHRALRASAFAVRIGMATNDPNKRKDIPPGGDINSIEDLATDDGSGSGHYRGLVWPTGPQHAPELSHPKWTTLLTQQTGLMPELCTIVVAYSGSRAITRAVFDKYFTFGHWMKAAPNKFGSPRDDRKYTADDWNRTEDDMRGDPYSSFFKAVPPNLSSDPRHATRQERFLAHCTKHWTKGVDRVTYFQNGVFGNGSGVHFGGGARSVGAGGHVSKAAAEVGSIVDDWMIEARFELPPYAREVLDDDRMDVCPAYGYVYARFWTEETYDGNWVYFARTRGDLLRYACPPVVREAIKRWDPIGYALDCDLAVSDGGVKLESLFAPTAAEQAKEAAFERKKEMHRRKKANRKSRTPK